MSIVLFVFPIPVSPTPGEVGFAASTSAIPQRQDRQITRHGHVSVSSAHPQLLEKYLFVESNCANERILPEEVHFMYCFIRLNSPPPDKETQELHAWNPDDSEYIRQGRRCFHVSSTSGRLEYRLYKRKMGYTHGFHVWQMTWPQRQRGTHAVVGVSNKIANLHAVGYTSLIGTTTESYGWDLTRGECYHDSRNCNPWTYPFGTASGKSGLQYNVPDQFYCILDMDEGYLAFATDDEFLGVAFRNLKGQTLYPIVAAVWGHCEITMKYLGGLDPAPLSLMEICRRSFRQQLGGDRLCRLPELPYHFASANVLDIYEHDFVKRSMEENNICAASSDDKEDSEDDPNKETQEKAEEENKDCPVEETKWLPVKDFIKTITAFMNVFAKFGDARSVYLEPKLRQMYEHFLTNGVPDIQASALNCIFSYKDESLNQYREQLTSLHEDKGFSEKLSLLIIEERMGEPILADNGTPCHTDFPRTFRSHHIELFHGGAANV